MKRASRLPAPFASPGFVLSAASSRVTNGRKAFTMLLPGDASGSGFPQPLLKGDLADDVQIDPARHQQCVNFVVPILAEDVRSEHDPARRWYTQLGRRGDNL